MMSSGQILSEGEAKRMAYFGRPDEVSQSIHGTPSVTAMESNLDRVFSFRASFTGFTCSLIDSVPSEIAVATLKNVNALARWNSNRTTDGSVVVSIGWLQVDNHVPNAPFPVAVSPDRERGSDESAEEGDEAETKESPLLLVGLTFAPQHKSGILVSLSCDMHHTHRTALWNLIDVFLLSKVPSLGYDCTEKHCNSSRSGVHRSIAEVFCGLERMRETASP
jgi:hypothetical protein